MKIKKSAWQHNDEWFIFPCPKVMIEKSGKSIYLTFEISFLRYTAYFSFFFNRRQSDLIIGI